MKLLIDEDWIRKFDPEDLDEVAAGASGWTMVRFRERGSDKIRTGLTEPLYHGSEQTGISYEEGPTKVWICIEDIEILP